jgi:hypothetical protein
MYCVSVLDLDARECVCVLQHPAGVYQSLSLGGDVYVFGCRQLRLDVGNRGGGGEGEDMLLVVCSLDVECDLRLFGRRGGSVFGHDAVGSDVRCCSAVQYSDGNTERFRGVNVSPRLAASTEECGAFEGWYGMVWYGTEQATSCWTLLERRRRRGTFVTSARCPASLACVWLSVRLPKARANRQASSGGRITKAEASCRGESVGYFASTAPR